jgi:hypothetical protein
MYDVSQIAVTVTTQACFSKYKLALHRILVSVSVLVLILVLMPASANAAVALEGETFLSTDIRSSGVRCDQKLGEIAFSITGTAAGPYVGTFFEEGFIDFDPSRGIILSVEITFRIFDRGGNIIVEGTKQLNDRDGAAKCGLDSSTGITSFFATSQLSYASNVDIGDATLSLKAETDKSGLLRSLNFTEVFHTSKILPPTLGKITGGGNILKNSNGGGVNFGFNAQSTDNGMKGSGVVVDHSSGKLVKIIDVTYLGVAGTQAVFLGTAEVNGVVEKYRIDVDDLGEPGIGVDTFSITTDSYRAEGVLTGGNIQIHK